MALYEVQGKVALVTGAGSGIGHSLTQLLPEAGCSVMADLRLRPEAEATLAQHRGPPSPSARGPASAHFHRTDVADWAQLQSLWETTLALFGRVDIVAAVAGIYEPPESNFWYPPGVSAESGDPADAAVGQYRIIAVNQVAPIRLAQMATDYWTQNKDVQGNFVAVASVGGFVKCMGGLRDICGIRYSAICPGAVLTPIFEPEWNRKVTKDDVHMTARECAAIVMRVMQEPKYGAGSVVETQKIGTHEKSEITVRDVPLEALYPEIPEE
ncbi:hypothetical protein COL940_004434 [Colletotrichum noveboracense]|nr:hypothetical protein COL940_004434 [Colletotrichum noveboracense]